MKGFDVTTASIIRFNFRKTWLNKIMKLGYSQFSMRH